MELKTKSAIHPPAKAGGLLAKDDKPNTTLFDWINYFSDFYKKSLLAK
jgi:hypothetical protein